jgi:spermidine/putrescine transport system substrate-binding protein
VRSSRREFLAGAAALLATAGCGLHQSDGVESFGAGYVSGPSSLDPVLRIAMPADGVAPVTIDSFQRRTDVDVLVTRFATDEELTLRMAADGTDGRIDAALVEDGTLYELVQLDELEPLDGKLVPGRGDLPDPFGDPAADNNLAHSVPLDYSYPGMALLRSINLPEATWEGFFDLALSHPRRVLVPDDPDTVIGAALLAAGHDWNSDDDGDLQDAEDVLRPLSGLLVVERIPRELHPKGPVAALSRSLDQHLRGPRARFAVPTQGTCVRVRSWCIPVYAPHPVSANAWLANALDPVYAAGESTASRRPTPVGDARALVPEEVLANPAIYPPPPVFENLVAPTFSTSGAAKRLAIWQDLGL